MQAGLKHMLTAFYIKSDVTVIKHMSFISFSAAPSSIHSVYCSTINPNMYSSTFYSSLPFLDAHASIFSDTVRQGGVFYYYWESDSIVNSIVAPDFKNENTCLHGVNCDCCWVRY